MMIESIIKRICVFCGSYSGAREVYGEQARALGREMAERGIGLVYGGGGIGMMGAVADAVIEAGGEVIGVIPYALAAKERARRDIDMRVVNTMHERKAMMAELSDAFIALPGGFGTFEELFETITWAQLGIHAKPIGLLNAVGYFDDLLRFLDRSFDDGFIKPKYRELYHIADDPTTLLERLKKHHPPAVERWLPKDKV